MMLETSLQSVIHRTSSNFVFDKYGLQLACIEQQRFEIHDVGPDVYVSSSRRSTC